MDKVLKRSAVQIKKYIGNLIATDYGVGKYRLQGRSG